MATSKVTAANFDEVVLKSSTPVLVDFWAEWCGPCRAIGPILEDLSNEYGEKLKIVKLNTDEESAIAIKYGVTSIPMLNVYVNGEVVKTIIGAKPSVISSSNSSFAPVRRMRAIASICCSPPERRVPMLLLRSNRLGNMA